MSDLVVMFAMGCGVVVVSVFFWSTTKLAQWEVELAKLELSPSLTKEEQA